MAPKIRLPAAALSNRWEEPHQDDCCDTACRASTFSLTAAHSTGGLLAISMISAILQEQSQSDADPNRRSLGLLAQPLAAFAVLPCLGTLLVKAPDVVKALRLLCSSAFVLCLLVDLMLPSLFMTTHKVSDALPVLSMLLGFCEGGVKLALLSVCENQAVKCNEATRLAEGFAVAYLLNLWGKSLGVAMALAPWGKNGYFTNFTSEKCVAGSTCMRMQICGLLCIPFQLIALVLALRLPGDRKRWRNSPSAKVQEEAEERNAENELDELFQDPGTNLALVSSLLCGIALLCARERAKVFSTPLGRSEAWNGRLLSSLLAAAMVPRLLRSLGAFGAWLVAAVLTAAMLLVSPMVAGLWGEVWAALATGVLPLFFFALPLVVLLRRARARNRVPTLALALGLATQKGALVLWNLIESFVVGLEPWLGALCGIWAAVLCSRALVCDRDGQLPMGSSTPATV
ncbi:unnamed protein product [Durusdinium trenchii]|uniref:Protein RFT1 homolog n=1 Tax=Durusdinium trenchii TaxID=1381693 RepID=A0ABP0M3Q0_9DINO